MECYNPENDWWSFVASTLNPLAKFSACKLKGKIYILRGFTARDRDINILWYCPTSDFWTNCELSDIHGHRQQMLSVEKIIYLVGCCTKLKIQPK